MMKKPRLEIEKVTKNNFNDFLEQINKLAEYEKKNPPDVIAQQRLMKDYLSEKPIYYAYLGKIDNKYIGYIFYYFTYSSYKALPILHIEDLFIQKEYRKEGLGQKLFDFCIGRGIEKGCINIEWTTYNWNEPAIKFYEKNKATRLDKSYYQLNIENNK